MLNKSLFRSAFTNAPAGLMSAAWLKFSCNISSSMESESIKFEVCVLCLLLNKLILRYTSFKLEFGFIDSTKLFHDSHFCFFASLLKTAMLLFNSMAVYGVQLLKYSRCFSLFMIHNRLIFSVHQCLGLYFLFDRTVMVQSAILVLRMISNSSMDVALLKSIKGI